MIKKISVVFCTLMIFIMSFTCNIAYADANSVEGIYVNKPDIKFYLNGEYNKSDIENVKLNEETLSVDEVSKYNISNESVAAYVVIDISNDMGSNAAINVFKSELINYAGTFGDDDSFILYTMGNKPEKKLTGGEDIRTVTKTINSISKTGENSSIYSTLNNIYEESLKTKKYDRQFVLMISNGINWNNNTSYQTISEKLESHSLPVYSLLYDTGAINSENKVADYKDLVAKSGGEIVEYNANFGKGKLKSLINKIDNKTLVRCNSKSNTVSDDAVNNRLSLTCRDKKLEVQHVNITTDNVDNSAPSVKGDIIYNNKTGNFEITFTEDITVSDFEKIKISKGKKELKINQPSVKENQLIIRPREEVYSGQYTFNLDGITDISNEKNQVSPAVVVQKVKAKSVFLKILKNYWWILLVIALLIAILLILLLAKKKKNVKHIREIFEEQVEEEVVEQKHTQVVKKVIQNAPAISTKKLSMIVEFNSLKRKINMDVQSSIIIGRSSDCDICIEDTKLSRQHFAIEVIDGNFAVSDLRTTNGTYVNGIRVTTKQLLHTGDKIIAGSCLFIIL